MFKLENVKQKIDTWAKTNSLLFNEKFKALVFSLIALHRRSPATFNEIFEGSGLKRMGASTGTVSNALKALEKAGVIVKEKAPFPFKARYKLLKREPALDKFDALLETALGQLNIGSTEPIEVFPEIAKSSLFLAAKHIREGNDAQCALIGFLLLNYMFHIALNLPSTMYVKIEKDSLK